MALHTKIVISTTGRIINEMLILIPLNFSVALAFWASGFMRWLLTSHPIRLWFTIYDNRKNEWEIKYFDGVCKASIEVLESPYNITPPQSHSSEDSEDSIPQRKGFPNLRNV